MWACTVCVGFLLLFIFAKEHPFYYIITHTTHRQPRVIRQTNPVCFFPTRASLPPTNTNTSSFAEEYLASLVRRSRRAVTTARGARWLMRLRAVSTRVFCRLFDAAGKARGTFVYPNLGSTATLLSQPPPASSLTSEGSAPRRPLLALKYGARVNENAQV